MDDAEKLVTWADDHILAPSGQRLSKFQKEFLHQWILNREEGLELPLRGPRTPLKAMVSLRDELRRTQE